MDTRFHGRKEKMGNRFRKQVAIVKKIVNPRELEDTHDVASGCSK